MRQKFLNARQTADGAPRAHVRFSGLKTLWVNTGTLCNIECANCYIESSPRNDRLAYMTPADIAPFLDEAASLGALEIGFTGGEPFLNPHMPELAADALARGFSVLILTNAMKPMMRPSVQDALIALNNTARDRLQLRVSLDHHEARRHDRERGVKSFDKAMAGLCWLSENGFRISVAGRAGFGETDHEMRAGFAALFAQHDIAIDPWDIASLILFPEMNGGDEVPEITEACWDILGKDPNDMMCASARMVVKRRGGERPVVLACTLLAYDEQFELGATVRDAQNPVYLNHRHCAAFCVLGGARCSDQKG